MNSDPSCAGSEAVWVVVLDTLAHSQQLVDVVVTATFFGLATSLAIASVYILSGKGVRRRSAVLQLTATLILYASTATFTGAALRAIFATASQAAAAANAINDCDAQALFNPIALSALGDRMTCIQTGTLVVNIVVGDAVVWWRVYMLWPGVKANRVILAVSATLLAATFAMSVVDTCGACNFHLSIVESASGLGQLFSGTLFGLSAVSMSLATNAVATCFSGYRAWIHVRSLKHLSRRLTFTGAEQILVLVAESGFVYSAIWVLVVIWQAGENNNNIFTYGTGSASFWGVIGYFVNSGLVPVVAIYPMLIIVIVALKRTQREGTYMFSTQVPSESQLPVASLSTPAHGGGTDGSTPVIAGSINSDLPSVETRESQTDIERGPGMGGV
ncbi:hypothetical protein C8T65DRAFT_835336 [Cerioporus squamosus]|nr:hypothetical protein C8T65DRAFT_835336 [Cerioporus squamosus]